MGFCLSSNLAFYFRKKDVPIEEWQLFLLMNPIGFSYFHLGSPHYEILNGINNTTEGFLNQVIEPIGYKKNILRQNHLKETNNRDRFWLMEVDDYHLEYNPFYQTFHNTRFIVVVGKTDDYYEVFDMEPKMVSTNSLENSCLAAFELKKKTRTVEFNVNDFLMRRFQASRSLINEDGIANIKIFAEELESQRHTSDREVYQALFFFVNRPAGPAIIHKMTGMSLLRLAEVVNVKDNVLMEKAHQLIQISELWLVLGNLFFKLSKKNSTKTMDSVCHRLQEIIKREETL